MAGKWSRMADSAFISRYALGRDCHQVLRGRLQELAGKITVETGHFSYRVTDSAPVMEVEWAQKFGLGWRGKHTLLLSGEAGSMFFLGELYTDTPLPINNPVGNYCGCSYQGHRYSSNPRGWRVRCEGAGTTFRPWYANTRVGIIPA